MRLIKLKTGGRFSRTAFNEEEIVGSAERYQNIARQGIVKLGISTADATPQAQLSKPGDSASLRRLFAKNQG